MKRFLTRRYLAVLVVAVAAGALVPAALSTLKDNVSEGKAFDYLVTMTNLTSGQPMSPPMAATHAGSGVVWSLGQTSSFALKEIAENGNNAPMYYDLEQARHAGTVYDFAQGVSTQRFPSPIVPAGRASPVTPFPQSVSFRIRGNRENNRLSVASMLVCTNDGFTGVDGLALPTKEGDSVTVDLQAYDTGTEIDNQLLANMMPPCQGLIGVPSSTGAPGEAVSRPALAEHGTIGVHAGLVAGVGDLQSIHFWTGPVGRLTVTRLG
jgi:hypothetical protein